MTASWTGRATIPSNLRASSTFDQEYPTPYGTAAYQCPRSSAERSCGCFLSTALRISLRLTLDGKCLRDPLGSRLGSSGLLMIACMTFLIPGRLSVGMPSADRSYRSPSGGLAACQSIQYCKAHLSVVELNTTITLDEDMLLTFIRGHGLPKPAIEPSTLSKVRVVEDAT